MDKERGTFFFFKSSTLLYFDSVLCNFVWIVHLCRTAVKDRVVGLLLFMGKIAITAAIGTSSCCQGLPVWV